MPELIRGYVVLKQEEATSLSSYHWSESDRGRGVRAAFVVESGEWRRAGAGAPLSQHDDVTVISVRAQRKWGESSRKLRAGLQALQPGDGRKEHHIRHGDDANLDLAGTERSGRLWHEPGQRCTRGEPRSGQKRVSIRSSWKNVCGAGELSEGWRGWMLQDMGPCINETNNENGHEFDVEHRQNEGAKLLTGEMSDSGAHAEGLGLKRRGIWRLSRECASAGGNLRAGCVCVPIDNWKR